MEKKVGAEREGGRAREVEGRKGTAKVRRRNREERAEGKNGQRLQVDRCWAGQGIIPAIGDLRVR